MATLQVPPTPIFLGGISCHNCRYWHEYQDKTVTELLQVNGNWGRCINPVVNEIAAMTEGDKLLGVYKHQNRVRVIRIPEVSVIVSTIDTWVCPHHERKE